MVQASKTCSFFELRNNLFCFWSKKLIQINIWLYRYTLGLVNQASATVILKREIRNSQLLGTLQGIIKDN